MKVPFVAAVICLVAMTVHGKAAGPGKSLDEKLKADDGYGAYVTGIYLYNEKETKKAEDAFQYATEKNDTLGRAWGFQGDILFEKGDFAAAVKCYEEAMKREPDYCLMSYNLACAASHAGDKAKALAAIEETLRLGYDRFEMLESDEDLKAAREGPEFAALLAKYQKTPVEKTAVTKFMLLKKEEEKMAMLDAIGRLPGVGGGKDNATDFWKPVADKALVDSSENVRIGGLNLYKIFGDDDTKLDALVRGLFDNNGYVKKFAANALVGMGEKALPYMDAIRASNYDGVNSPKYFEKQIRALIKEKPAHE